MSVEIASRLDLKRDRESFEELIDLEEPCSVPADFVDAEEQENEQTTDITSNQLLETDLSTTPHPITSNPSSTLAASPNLSMKSASATSESTAPPPPKKTKLSEKEIKKINKEIKDREKAEEKARKEAEKLAQAEEKARKGAEKEAERKRKEAEKAEKEAEKRRKEAEKAEKEAEKEAEKRRKEAEKAEKEAEKRLKEAEREEKRRKIEEKKQKDERSQMKLGRFFGMPPANKQRAGSVDSEGRTSMSPAPPSSNSGLASPAIGTPSKPKLDYEALFPPFFVQSGVTLAPSNRFERDEPATDHIERQLDSYLSGAKTFVGSGSFDAISLFNMSNYDSAPRGKRCVPVREIMEEFYSGKTSRLIELTTESQNSQIKRTQDRLQKIPLKYLKFPEDVRPPYRGTYTSRPVNGIARLARKPFSRDLPHTDYDYDSEAEWIEDEDGEDLKSGDEEEEIDDDEDMDGFLDDEGDDTANSKRLVLQGDLEPESTGLCWEDRKKRSSNVKMLRYRMEIILAPTMKSIDPFSTSYWESTTTSMEPPRIPLNTMKATSLNFNGSVPSTAPGAKPVKSFFTAASDSSLSASSKPLLLGQTTAANLSTKDGNSKRLLPAEDMEAFKAAVVGSDLTKIGLIEVLKRKFYGRPAAVIKYTLETYAKRGRAGEKEKEKRWMFIDPNGM